MSQNKNGRVISPKALIKTALIEWRMMLIIGLILPFCLVDIEYNQQRPSVKTADTDDIVASSSEAGSDENIRTADTYGKEILGSIVL